MRIADPEGYISELRRHSNELRVMADQLERDRINQGGSNRTFKDTTRVEEYIKVAESMLEMRSLRERIFSNRTVASGGWDILLFLFIQTSQKRETSVSSTSFCTSVPQTTALRTIDRLESEGLIERSKAAPGSRHVNVRLTDTAQSLMLRFFTSFHLRIGSQVSTLPKQLGAPPAKPN